MFGRKVVQIEVSPEVYDEIALAMVNAGATVAMVDGALDMRSVRLVRGDELEEKPRHRSISGKAPGAIA